MTAIYCTTCDKYYHLNCFELDDDGEEEEEQIVIETGIDNLIKQIVVEFSEVNGARLPYSHYC